jgi:hypothetical protein
LHPAVAVNPVFTGMGEFRAVINDAAWREAAGHIIAELGVDAFMGTLTAGLRMTLDSGVDADFQIVWTEQLIYTQRRHILDQTIEAAYSLPGRPGALIVLADGHAFPLLHPGWQGAAIDFELLVGLKLISIDPAGGHQRRPYLALGLALPDGVTIRVDAECESLLGVVCPYRDSDHVLDNDAETLRLYLERHLLGRTVTEALEPPGRTGLLVFDGNDLLLFQSPDTDLPDLVPLICRRLIAAPEPAEAPEAEQLELDLADEKHDLFRLVVTTASARALVPADAEAGPGR